VSATVEETLAHEAERRPRAGAIAIAAGVLTLLGNILLVVLTRGGPTEDDGFISVTESISSRLAGQAPQGDSLFVRLVDFYGDNVLPLTLTTLLTTLAAVLTALTLIFLYRATLARDPNVGRAPVIATIAGVTLYAVGHLAREITTWIAASGFADAEVRNGEAARDVFREPLAAAGSVLELLGTFGIALGFGLVALRAMRVGLLTRFLGILGIIVAALAVFQVDQPRIVQTFWLIGVGLVILRRAPGGTPPAWETGRAEPWPSQQQLAEARAAARAARDGSTAPPPSENGTGTPETPAQKRKRKRRK
jgi:hypothetical protein